MQPSRPKKFHTINASFKDLPSLAKKLAKELRGGEVIGLIGPLGSGKTTFTKLLGQNLGIKNTITSPTFTVMQEYKTNKPVLSNPKRKIYFYHLDLYRTSSDKEIDGLGISQIWQHPEVVVIIEWADKFLNKLPKETKLIRFNN